MKTILIVAILLPVIVYSQNTNQEKSVIRYEDNVLAVDFKFLCADTLYFDYQNIGYKVSLSDITGFSGDPVKVDFCNKESFVMYKHMLWGKKSLNKQLALLFIAPVGYFVALSAPVAGIAIGVFGAILGVASLVNIHKAFKIGQDYFYMQNALDFNTEIKNPPSSPNGG